MKWGTTNGSLSSSAAVLKNVGDINVGANNVPDYKAILKKLKDTVKGMQFVNAAFNTSDLRRRTRPADIYNNAPYSIINAIDVGESSGV